jgi:tetratricopeptide (TPR) repeat protein
MQTTPLASPSGLLTDLATTPIAETLRRLAVERRSGDLQVRSSKLVKTVFFDHGRIVFAGSNLKKDRLGESLVALGQITDEEYVRAQAVMKVDRRKRFGEALVQAGVLDKNQVGRSVARQVNRIVLSLFDLKDGAGSFEERRCTIPLEYMVSLSIPRILYEGIRTMTNRELVLGGLGDLDRWVKMAEVPPFSFDIRECSSEEMEVLQQSHRRVTLRRLAWAPGGLAFGRLLAAYALYASGVLEDADRSEAQPGAPPPVVQMETGTFLLSALRRRPDPSTSEAIRQEVAEELERSAKLDRESWLKVSASAPRAELIRALEEKMERYHALLEAASDGDLKTDIEVILGRASAMLRLTRQAPPPAKPAAGAGSTAGVAPAAAPAAVAPPSASAEAPGPSAAPPAVPPSAAAPAPAVAKPVVAPVAPAAAGSQGPDEAAPPDRPAPERPAKGVAAPEPTDPGSSPARAPEAAPAVEPATAAAVEDGMMSGTAQIEHLLMEGEVRMTVSDYANAVRVYERLVKIAPKVAAYRTRLAIAMACYPRTAKQAEREFLDALLMDPDNADIHYQFGLYYKAMKQRARALAEMRTAVRLNPRHRNARQELEALSPKDSALTSLKKLFR